MTMLNPVISCIVYMAEMMIAWIFFSGISHKSRSTPLCLLLGIFLFETGAFVNLLLANNLLINLLTAILIHFLFATLCFRLRVVSALLYALLLTAVNTALEFITVLFVSALVGSELLAYNNDFSLFIIECPVSKLLYLFTCLMITKFAASRKDSVKLPLSLFANLIAAIACIMIFWYVCIKGNVSESGQFMLVIASLILFVSTILLFITWQHESENVLELSRIRAENNRLQVEKSYYQILEQQNQQLMAYAHDAKNHLSAIRSLNADPRIDSYLSQLSHELQEYSGKCHSGNKLLDVIIAKYQMQCETLGIEFDYDFKRCNLSGINDIDLVAIMGNLLDNAMEAASILQNGKIHLSSFEGNGYKILVLSNSCISKPEDFNGELVSSKEDHQHHGYGLKNVSRALNKYGGDFAWDYDELSHIFTITVMIGKSLA